MQSAIMTLPPVAPGGVTAGLDWANDDHAVCVVDVDAEAARREQLDGQHVDTGHARLDRRCDLLLQRALSCERGGHQPPQQKWARRAHFVQPVKCGAGRIALSAPV